MSVIPEPQEHIDDRIAQAYSNVYRYAYVLTGSSDEAEELTQETIVKTLVRSRKSSDINDLSAYMIRVVLHEFFRARRRLTRVRQAETQVVRERSGLSVDIYTHELITSLSALSPRERATIVARYYLNLSESEVAEAMNCSVGSIKQYTSRAMKKLRGITSQPISPGRNVVTDVAVNR